MSPKIYSDSTLFSNIGPQDQNKYFKLLFVLLFFHFADEGAIVLALQVSIVALIEKTKQT